MYNQCWPDEFARNIDWIIFLTALFLLLPANVIPVVIHGKPATGKQPFIPVACRSFPVTTGYNDYKSSIPVDVYMRITPLYSIKVPIGRSQQYKLTVVSVN